MHKLCLGIGEYLSVITYSAPTQKCPMLDSYIGGMQGPRGVCTIYVYGVSHRRRSSYVTICKISRENDFKYI